MDPLEPKPSRPKPTSFDPVADIYDETRDKLSDAELRSLTKELEGSKTLELAVGTGRLAKPLQENGVDLTGIDVSVRMLNRAREKQALNLVRGEGTHLPFRDQAFDAVLVVHFLHLAPDWPSLLSEITRVAREKLVSVDSRTTSTGMRPRRLYIEKVAQKGFPSSVKSMGELLLAEKVKPHKMELIDKAVDAENMDRALEMLQKRWLAVSWTVPEDIHKEVVEELRREFAGKTVDYSYETFLLVWNVKDLSKAIPYL